MQLPIALRYSSDVTLHSQAVYSRVTLERD